VCFRDADGAWHALLRGATSVDTFQPTPPNNVTFNISDRREGRLGMFRLERQATSFSRVINTNRNGLGNDGDMVRLLPNVTDATGAGCDLVFGSSVINTATVQAQEYNASRSSIDMGTYCVNAGAAACTPAALTPTDVSLSAVHPYTEFNMDGDDFVAPIDGGAVAAIPIPNRFAVSGRVQACKVCYKPAHMNWIEATDTATGSVIAAPSVLLTGQSHATLYGGSYVSFDLTAATSDAITWSTAVAKLVLFAATCTGRALGTHHYGNAYVSQAGAATTPHGRGRRRRRVEHGAGHRVRERRGHHDERQGVHDPADSNATGAGTATAARLCFVARASTTDPTVRNWHDLSGSAPVTVHHLGVTWIAATDPVQFSAFTLRLLSDHSSRRSPAATPSSS
jgi:hypothetical protein